MSGCGRKGAYRKGVTNDVLHGNPIPEEGELVAKVKGSRGGNIIDIHCGDNSEGIAVMPQKFRKLIWVKRGDYVIVSGAQEDEGASDEVENGGNNSGLIRYRVKHILYKDQIRHIKSVNLWPNIFNDVQNQDEEQETSQEKNTTSTSLKKNQMEITNDYSDDEDSDINDEFINPNLRKIAAVSSDEEDDEEED